MSHWSHWLILTTFLFVFAFVTQVISMTTVGFFPNNFVHMCGSSPNPKLDLCERQ